MYAEYPRIHCATEQTEYLCSANNQIRQMYTQMYTQTASTILVVKCQSPVGSALFIPSAVIAS